MFIRIRVRAAYVTMRAKLSEMNSYLHEQVTGMPVVQMFNRQQASLDGYGEINQAVRGSQLSTVYWETSAFDFGRAAVVHHGRVDSLVRRRRGRAADGGGVCARANAR